MLRVWLAVAVLLASVIMLGPAAPPAVAAPGDLDPAFGGTGQVVTDVTGHFSQARAVALQPDGKVVAAGTVAPNGVGEASDFTLVRYLADGTLDGSFGAGGVVTTDLGGDLDDARAVAVQPDGKIVVVGATAGPGPSPDLAVVRYLPDGSLDSTFGDRGVVVSDAAVGVEAFSVTLQRDGKIVVGGGGAGASLVARFQADGTLDEPFGDGGLASPGVFGEDARVTGIAVQPDGHIVGFGPSDGDFAGFRLTGEGERDYSFGVYGAVRTDIAGRDDEARAVALLPDGRIVVAGRSNDDIAVVRYTAFGQVDDSFGDGGHVVSDFSEGLDEASSVLALAEDRILVGGVAGEDFALVRYQASGELDAGFGGVGLVTTDFAGRADHAAAFVRLPDGRITAVGAARTSLGEDFAAARYAADGTLDAAFGTAGTVTTDLTSTSDRIAAVRADPATGGMVAAGYAATGNGWDFALAKYRADGTPDPSFGLDGEVVTDLSGGGDDLATALAVLPEASGLMVAGRAAGGGESLLAVARYRADGTLNPFFGEFGMVRLDLLEGTRDQGADAVAVQPDGKTLAAGFAGDRFAVVRLAEDGSPDPTFGADGVVLTDVDGDAARARAIAVQPDGKIVVVGDAERREDSLHSMGSSLAAAAAQIFGSDLRRIVVARYLPDGQLDDTFGNRGLVIPADLGLHGEANAVALQPDGKIVVAGWGIFSEVPGTAEAEAGAAAAPAGDISVLRLAPDGSPDGSFGGDGHVNTDVALGRDVASAVAVQPDGTITVAGVARIDGTDDFAAVRYDAGGSLDTSFDADGIVTTNFGGHDRARAMIPQESGAIVAAGSAGSAGNVSRTAFALARYDDGGALDGSFGTGGTVTTTVSGDLDEARAVAVQPDGKVVAAGEARAGPAGDIAVLRYLPDGTLDPKFGFGGRVTTDISHAADGANAVAVQPDGKIVVAGRAAGGPEEALVVVRYLTDGTIDEAFGEGGVVVTDLTEGRTQAHAVLVQPGGQVVVAGFAIRDGSGEAPPMHDFLAARYDATGQPDESFGGDGLVLVDAGGEDEAYAAALQPDGRLVAAGRSATEGSAGGGGVALARLNADGTVDGSFGNDGTVVTELDGPARADAVTVQPDGRLVVAGTVSRAPAGRDIAVLRYGADGALDGSFGDGGHTFGDAGPDDHASAVLVAVDGGVLVAGHSAREAFTDVALFRYRPDGRPDERFGASGVALGGLTGFSDEGAAVAFSPEGRAVVAGRALMGDGADFTADFTVLRFFDGPLGAATDLAVTVTDSADPVGLSVPFRYLVEARNLGTGPATGVVVTFDVPATLTVIATIPSQGPPCVVAAARVACPLGTVATAATAAVTLVAQASQAGALTGTVRVAGNEPDPNLANNTASADTTVQPPAVRVNPAVAPPGRVVSVIGTGFQPGVTVGLGFPGFAAQRTATPAGDGSFTVSLVVFPNTTPGARTLEARTAPAPAVVLATTRLLVVPDTLAPPNFVARN